MGIIRKQTVSGSIFSYAGVLLGFLNLAVLSPLIFTSEQIGLPSLLLAISVIASQFGSFGFNSVTIRLFPYFRNEENHHGGFLGMTLIVQTIGLLIVLGSMVFFIPYLINRNLDDISILGTFAFLLVPFIVFQHYTVLFDSFCRVLYNATLGIILKEFVVRVLNLIIILLFYFGFISFATFMYLYVLSFGVPLFVLLIYLFRKGELSFKINFNSIAPSLRKEIISVALFGILAGLSGQAVVNIDKYMINDFLNLSSLGIYTIAFSFGTLILIPGRAMAKIAAPVLANFWKDKDESKILEVYQKSSVNQFLGGLVLFILLWINIEDVFILLPEKYGEGKLVILFIALANLMTVLSGVSLSILSTSRHYQFHTYFMIVLVVLVVISNLIFIPRWGITGAAVATFISTALYVLIRIVFLKVRYNMHPFSLRHVTAAIAFLISYFAISQIPISFSPFANIIIRSLICGTVFIGMIYIFRCSPEFNDELAVFFRKFFRRSPK